MQTKVTVSGKHEAVDRLIMQLRAQYIVDDPFEPKKPLLPTSPVCRTVYIEIPTTIRPMRLVDTRVPYQTIRKEAA